MFWVKAVFTFTCLINRIPSTLAYGLSLFHTLYAFPPNYSCLRVFGCNCYVLLPTHERTKSPAKSHMCVFLGYGLDKKRYRVLIQLLIDYIFLNI